MLIDNAYGKWHLLKKRIKVKMKEKRGNDISYFLSNMLDDSFLVFDFDNFLGNSNPVRNIFGYKNANTNKFVHPNDLIFFKDVCCVIRDIFNTKDFPLDNIYCFAFLLQVGHDLQSDGYTDYFMTYVKLKVLLENGQPQTGVCTLSASIQREQERRLVVYYKNMDYSVYSFHEKKWKFFPFSPLAPRQKEMLTWARQGYSLKESAEKMGISGKTIENMRRTIFEKFGVTSIEQAIRYAINRQLIDRFG